MNESQAAQRIHAYLTHELGYPTELIQREYQTSRNARLDLVVMLDGRIRIVCEAKRLDKLPRDAKLLPFNALIRQIQFAALEVGAPFFLVSDGQQMLWFETDESGRPMPLAVPKTYRDLVGGGSDSPSRANRVAGVRRTLRSMLERSRQQRWSPEALALILYGYLQRKRGREMYYKLLVGGSDFKPALAAARSESADAPTGFVETLAFVAKQDLISSREYEEALELLDDSALDKLAPADALSLLDDILGRYPTSSGATRLPRWTSDLLVRLADIQRGNRVLDLHCGLGNLSAAVRLAGTTPPSHMAVFARHATDAMWTCVQQLVFGPELPSISIGDPFESERHTDPQGSVADRILVAPPFGLSVQHERFSDRRGALSSEEAYLHHALERLSPTGRIVALLPNGPLGSPDRSPLRELLLRNGLQAVIDVGAFQPDSAAAASIIVLDKSAPSSGPLFFAKAQNRQQQDSFDCTSLPGLPHVLQRFGSWMQDHGVGNDDDVGLTATATPAQGVLSAGPYLARQAQRQLPLASFKHHPLESLALVTKGGAIRRSKDAGDVVFIGPGAIRPLEIQLDPLDRADHAEVLQYPKAVASEGDIVLNGLSTYLGAAAFIESGRFPINRHVFCIRVHNALVLPEYLAIAINSRYVHEALIADAGGSVMTMLRLDVLRRVLIPVPPREIQAEIVRRVALAKEERDAVERALQQKVQALSALVRNLDLGEPA